MRTLLCVVLVLTSLVGDIGAQDTAARVLLATVVDARGRTVVDFGVDDFVVSEGSRNREVLDVHVADYPVALLLDDQAPAALWPAMQAAAIRFIIRIGERPVMIATLSDDGQIISALDAGRDRALERLRAFTPARGGTPTALAAIAGASRHLTTTESPFSAVVVVSAGAVDAAAPVRADLLPGIVTSGASVHVVEERQATTTANEAGDDLLKVVADQTRGQYTTIYSPASFSIALDRLADRLAAELMIQYLVPPGDRTGDAKVGVRRPGALVLGLGVSK
ncbi:MAG: hypothetical protein ABL961_07695 [Vicinamibacterales bacterium]